MDDLIIAIVGGTISTVLGGIILVLIRPIIENRYTSTYSSDTQGCAVTFFKLLMIGFANAIAIAVFWGLMEPGGMDFGVLGSDVFIKVILLLIMNAAIFAKLFFDIDLFK